MFIFIFILFSIQHKNCGLIAYIIHRKNKKKTHWNRRPGVHTTNTNTLYNIILYSFPRTAYHFYYNCSIFTVQYSFFFFFFRFPYNNITIMSTYFVRYSGVRRYCRRIVNNLLRRESLEMYTLEIRVCVCVCVYYKLL